MKQSLVSINLSYAYLVSRISYASRELKEYFMEKITVDLSIAGGMPCIRGTRIPVHIIIGLLKAGETCEGILKAYPHISKDDIEACVQYEKIRIGEKS